MTLTDFLLARLAEDEHWAAECEKFYPSRNEGWEVSDRGWLARIWADEMPTTDGVVNVPEVASVEQESHDTASGWLGDRLQHIARHDPARVLAECEAKRRIVALAGHHGDEQAEECLIYLAAIYADHPDFRDEWRP